MSEMDTNIVRNALESAQRALLSKSDSGVIEALTEVAKALEHLDDLDAIQSVLDSDATFEFTDPNPDSEKTPQ